VREMDTLYLISCEIMRHEIEHLLAQTDHPPQVCFLRKGYHENPAVLRDEVQKAIDAAPTESQAILLGYGLCGKGLEGVEARGIPLIIPRVHDCISLLLGSARAYDEHFSANPGTYYYSPGWVEWGRDAVERAPSQGLGLGASFEEYAVKFGEDNARWLVELQAGWARNYTRAAYIDTGIPDCNGWEDKAIEIARANGWIFERINGSLRLLRMLLEGPWPESEFVTVPPAAKMAASGDSSIIRAR